MPRTINGRKKQQDFDIVVASDNNDYLAWQCLVFHHSCLTHLGRAPIIVVHGDGPLASGRIAREWAALTEDCLMTSFRHHGHMNSEVWISTMWAFVLVALRIDVPITVTAMCVMNDRIEVNQTLALKNGQMVHYGYGDDFFNKKNYMNEDDSLNAVWKGCAPEGAVNGAVTRAIHEAAVFYDLAWVRCCQNTTTPALSRGCENIDLLHWVIRFKIG